jgi:DNA-binding PadR family transcriptional regulator
MTVQTCMVLAEFDKDPDAELYGFEIKQATGLKPGTLYPILRRLEGAGWLTARWELKPAGSTGRIRCYYTLTPEGRTAIHQEAILERSRL